MKFFKYITASLMLSLVFFMFSCEKNKVDTQNPVISIISPEEEEVVYIGSEIHFEVDFADDVELKSYKVDIHSNFDGHNHKSALKGESVAWSFQKSWNFEEGKKTAHIHHHEIVIPIQIERNEITEGEYHLMVYCTDASGNESWTAVPIDLVNMPAR